MTTPAWKRTLLTCFDVKERPGDKHSKLYSCRYCNDPSWQDKRQESVTRLLEHITGLRRKDGKPRKQCVGKVALEVRNQLRDHMQSVSTQRPATSTRRAASEAPPLPILPAEDVGDDDDDEEAEPLPESFLEISHYRLKKCSLDAGIHKLRSSLDPQLKRAVFYISATESTNRNKRKRVLRDDV